MGWNVEDLSVLASGTPDDLVGAPGGYAGGLDHVLCLSADGNIHQASSDGVHPNTWRHEIITANAPLALGHPCGDGDAQAVYYRGQDDHLHELVLTANDWVHTDLTLTTQTPLLDSDPSVFHVDLSDGYSWLRHVHFHDADGHVHELSRLEPPSTNVAWKHLDFTALTGAPPATQQIASISTLSGRSVFYLTGEGTVHEVTPWGHYDLTRLANAPLPASNLTALLDTNAGLDGTFHKHVFYIGFDRHVHELWSRDDGSNQWHHHDLSQATHAPPAYGDPSAYFADVDLSQRVYYGDADGHVHELSWSESNAWTDHDLTKESRAPISASDPKAFSFDAPEGQVRQVVYRSRGQLLMRLWVGTSWPSSGGGTPGPSWAHGGGPSNTFDQPEGTVGNIGSD